ncbi:serine hydrolase [Hymenobacter busanensis]|uniref:Serine hydrolase n=1 Tax=Hymenobacter busanensis TaxID=2607656 RepID=A0A7L4ZZP3_9BACT|nr:serine hydrolase [Hymenobacter busanensis]KAA9332050.1 serine hydrolase [Hymenobacter busanensis]QHJ07612.1 serine hydrolase [Hymenobacter busanensis]
MKHWLLVLAILLWRFSVSAQGTSLYFPPTTGTAWAATSPQSLGWCQPRLDSLLNFLGRKHTKSFIILKNGRLVVEQYYGTFTRDSLWYWASAGKSLTATLVGIAQQDGLLSLDDTTSRWLGRGWTSAPNAKERLIKVRHQLTMTTGLDDTPPAPCDNESTRAACLLYRADAGTRWAYHTGPYRLLQNDIAAASGLTINQYTNQKIGSRIGMGGGWLNDVYYSRARDMARFGLLMLNRGTWDQTVILRDTTYFRRMTTPSQAFNRSYGYLWWLNGQPTYMLPTSPLVYNGPLVPSAPADLIAALGKNDQKIYVVPSLGLVVVRQGNSAAQSKLAVSSFDTELWQYIGAMLNCITAATTGRSAQVAFEAYPNPASSAVTVQLPAPVPPGASLLLTDMLGRVLHRTAAVAPATRVSVDGVSAGLYQLQLVAADGTPLGRQRLVKQ